MHVGSRSAAHGGRSWRSGRHRKQRRIEPYAWLGAGAVTLGIGAAALSGAGIAAADDPGTDSTSTSSSTEDNTSSDPRTPSSTRSTDAEEPSNDKNIEPPGNDSDDEADHEVDSTTETDAAASDAAHDVDEESRRNRGRNDGIETDAPAPSINKRNNDDTEVDELTIVQEDDAPRPRGAEKPQRPAIAEVSPALTNTQSAPVAPIPDETKTTQLSSPESADALTAQLPDPARPFDTPLAWLLLASSRRQIGRGTDDYAQSLTADALAVDAENTAPEATLERQSSPGWFTGRVTGRVAASDVDGDPLSFTGITTAKGTVTVTPWGTFTYRPSKAARHAAAATAASDAEKFDTLTITVSDGNGGWTEVPVTVAVRPVNSSPSWLRSTTDKPYSVSGEVTGRITASDRDGDAFTYSASAPGKGAVVVNLDGTFSYTAPDSARAAARSTWYRDTDRFTVTVDDGHGGSRSITVRVEVAPSNRAPTAGVPRFDAPDPTSGAVRGTVNAVDPDGDRITYRRETITTAKGVLTIGGTGTFTYTPTTAARHAAATGDPDWTADSVTVTARDRFGGTGAIAVTIPIAPTNTSPVGNATGAGVTDPVTGVVRGTVTATDSDGDDLLFSGTTTTDKGSVVVDSIGTYTYTPTTAARHHVNAEDATDADRRDSFVVTVTDGHGGTAQVLVSVAIAPSSNQAPGGVSYSANPNTDTGVVEGRVTATDPEGDSLTFSGSAETGKGTVAVAPDGSFVYTPTDDARLSAGAPGAPVASKEDSFVVDVSDGHGGTTSISVSVEIVPLIDNESPVAGTPIVGDPTPGTGVVSGTLGFTDPEGSSLAYTVTGPPAKGLVSIDTTGGFTYTPNPEDRPEAGEAPGYDAFTVVATDPQGLAAQVTVDVVVAPLLPPSNGPVVGTPPYDIDSVDEVTGVISGHVTAYTSNGTALTFAVAESPDVASGRVALDSATGRWTFTPTASTLVSAWSSDTPTPVTFTIRVSDGEKSTDITVSATVSPSEQAVINSVEYLGSEPSGVTVGPDGRMYVIDSGANTLSIINPADASMITVTVGKNPTSVASDDLGRLWVTNSGDHTVTVLNAEAEILRTVQVGLVPASVVIRGDLAYIANFGGNSLSVIDAADDYSVRSVDVGTNPIDIAIGSDGRIYVANFGNGTISVLRPDDMDDVLLVDSGGEHPHGILVDDDGTVYVTHPLDDTVTVLNPAPVNRFSLRSLFSADATSGQYTYRSVTVIGAPTKITKDTAGQIYVTNSSGATITVLDPLTLAANEIHTGANPSSVYVDRFGNLYVTNAGQKTVAVIHAQTRNITTYRADVKTSQVTTDDDGNLVMVSTYDGHRSVLSTDTVSTGADALQIANVWGSYGSLVASPDGKWLYAVRNRRVDTTGGLYPNRYDIVAIDTSNNSVRTFAWDAHINGSMVLTMNRDGDRLYAAYYTLDPEVFDGVVAKVAIINVDGSTLQLDGAPVELNLGSTTAFVSDIVVNPAGTKVFVIGDRLAVPGQWDAPEGQWNMYGNLWMVDLENDRAVSRPPIPRPLQAEGGVPDLAISPDGRYAYLVMTPLPGWEGNHYLGIFDTQSFALTTVLLGHFEAPNGVRRLVVSPDGTRIYLSDGQIVGVTGTQHELLEDRIQGIDQERFVDIAINPEGTRLYTTTWDGVLTTIDTSTGLPVGNPTDLGNRAWGMTFGPKGDTLYVRRGVDYVASHRAPQSIADLWENVRDLPNGDNEGIFTQVVRHADGTNRMVVYLGGTNPRNWLVGEQAIGENVVSELGILKDEHLGAITRALAHCRNDATCGDIADVMLVGFSQGGIDGQNFASQWDRLGFGVQLSALVTFGSPITKNPNVPTLHIQDIDDEVVNTELLARLAATVQYVPMPSWLRINFAAATVTAMARGQLYQGAADTDISVLDIFAVHGNRATYQQLASEMDARTGTDFAALGPVRTFFGGTALIPGDPTPL
ncbi:Ig-like domain-containing protein [Mycolicibacterium sp. D5.8-2]|uniref:Ig-like domain-containing protein n=1 Tax=Mycolicibacterium sp. D5.8-2 TaxID=3085903 RepID=UPI00298C1A56|nr:Ig-like domain-containing protein [Mycolicibacterium sp. D5.8-2]